MHVIISVDGSVYTGKTSDEMTAAQASEITYDMLCNNEAPAMLVHLPSGGILVLGPEVVARAHITYYDE